MTHGSACCIGVILIYELWSKNADIAGSVAILVHNQSVQFDPLQSVGHQTSYTVQLDGLEPFTRYQVHVVTANAVGKTQSVIETGRTAEAGKLHSQTYFLT